MPKDGISHPLRDEDAMDPITTAKLGELAQSQNGTSVSFYMPTAHVESELAQNPIRLKNLIRSARGQLKAQGLREPEIEQILHRASALLERDSFWFEMSSGLAGFLTAQDAQFFRVPVSLDPLVVTANRFHLKPLFPLFAHDRVFFVLCLSKNRVRLCRGSRFGIEDIQTTEIPRNITDALPFEDVERQLQMHTGAKHSDGRHDGVFHGQGAASEEFRSRPNDALFRFFRQISEGVKEVLEDPTVPLVLAGVDYYLPVYRDVNKHPGLIDWEIISGNPDHLSQQDLHGRAWAKIEPMIARDTESSVEALHARLGRRDGLASEDIREIVPAAAFGRVDTVFVASDEYAWGRYDAENNVVELSEAQRAGDEDLLDFAAVHSFLNGGRVHVVPGSEMPVGAAAAATFRYPADVAAEQRRA
jgi:hypothetical protein